MSDDAKAPPAVFREVFYRVKSSIKPEYQIILAEAAKPLTDDAGYADLLLFERDIAQLVGLILLFVESAGSLAELGAFAALDEVAPQLLAVLTDTHYEQNSFVKNGPVRSLENRFGEEAVLSLDTTDINYADADLSKIDVVRFTKVVDEAVDHSLRKLTKNAKLKREISGHAVLVIVGLCQEFGALIEKELKECLELLGLPPLEGSRFKNYVYCAELLGWIKKVRKGHHLFYVATDLEHAIQFKFKSDAPWKDKVRWRAAIRDHWRKNDSSRHRAISQVLSSPSV